MELHEINFARLSIDGQERTDDVDTVLPDAFKSGSDMIDMIFRKDRVDDRKKWLETTTPGTYLDYTTTTVKQNGVRFTDFINKEFLLFSVYDNMRSIPHVIDGFKPSQRKVLFGCFKRKLKGEVKVAQLTGYIAEHSSYHHGEASLQGTIVAMASSFVGSNNVNLLTPCGQFGTRRMGGKDAASARYIFTKLEDVTRAIFHPDDDALLNYLNDDGATIEPDFYVPIIPMVLVNGADGIGSGWSTSIPNYNPRDIIANIRRMIAGEEIQAMVPNYQGFTGEITPKGDGKGSYIVKGAIERVDETTLVITELPIRTWTQHYKEFLEKMVTGTVLQDFKENHTETSVHFTITASKENIDEWEQKPGGLTKHFKLTGSLSTSNMVAFHEKKLTRFQSAENILHVFYDIRLEFYTKRKALLVKNLEVEQLRLSNKARFVEEVCTRKLVVSNRKKVEILADLQQQGYDTFLDKKATDTSEQEAEGDDSTEGNDSLSTAELAKGYEYLLGMKIWALTFEKAEALRGERDAKKAELDTLKATSPNQIWLNDLGTIEKALDERDAAIAAAVNEEKEARAKSKQTQSKTKPKKKQPAGKKRKNETDTGATPPRATPNNKRRLVSPPSGDVDNKAT
jgi:DNA topoisomerase-2